MNTINYACVKNGLVTDIIVFEDPNNEIIMHFKDTLLLDFLVPADIGAQTGGTYDGENFWEMQPYPSWILNQETHRYDSPTPIPTLDINNLKYYYWDEETISWMEIQ